MEFLASVPFLLASVGATAAPVAPTSQPAETSAAVYWVALGLAVAAIAGAVAAGVFRPRSVVGPSRLAAGQPAFALLIIMVGGLVLWQGIVPIVYFGFKQAQLASTQGSGARFDVAMLTASDFAWLATIPFAVGFLGLWLGDLLLDLSAGRRLFATVSDLGLRLRNLPAGLGKGLLGSLIAMPLMFWVLAGVEVFYRWIDFEHPKEHDLLRMMTESPSATIRWAFIAGAVIGAPFFEEYIFRGHLQTAIREGLLRLTSPRPLTLPPPPLPGAMSPTVSYEPLPVEALPAVPPQASAGQGWIAIVATSLAFTAIHMQLWMFPPIFALSLALGYAYERTGNLWASVVMHAVFNAGSTVVYLSQGGTS